MRKEEGRRRGEGKEEGRCKKEEGRSGREEGRKGGGRERGRKEKKGKRLEEGKYNQTDISYKGYKQMVFQVMLTS